MPREGRSTKLCTSWQTGSITRNTSSKCCGDLVDSMIAYYQKCSYYAVK